MEKIIGREKELSKLADYMQSGRSEFLAIYGRRRVGKTFLIRSFFKDKFDFYAIVTICEMKYSKDEFFLTENEYRRIVRRMETFSRETQHKGGVQATIVTTYSLHNNIYSEISPVAITMEHLFK